MHKNTAELASRIQIAKRRGWIKGALAVFALATMLGSYLSTLLDSFLSKEICCNLNSELERQ